MTRIQYVGFVVAGLVIGGGIVNASSPPGPVVINACADATTGALRLGSRCERGENAVTWNQQGPQGAQGAQGERGPSSARAITYDGPPEASYVQSPSVCGPFGQFPMFYVTDSKCYWHSAFLGNLGTGEHMLTARVSMESVDAEGDESTMTCDLHINPYVSNPNILDHVAIWPTYDFYGLGAGTQVTLMGSLQNNSFTQKPLYITCRSYVPFEAHDIKVSVVTVDEVTSVALP